MGPAALAESASRRAVMQASSSLQLRAAGASTPASEASLASPPPRNAPTPGQLRGATAATSLRETRAPSFGSRGGTDADEGLGGEEGDFVDKPCLCWGGTVGCEVRRLVGIAAPLSIGYFSSQAIVRVLRACFDVAVAVRGEGFSSLRCLGCDTRRLRLDYLFLGTWMHATWLLL